MDVLLCLVAPSARLPVALTADAGAAGHAVRFLAWLGKLGGSGPAGMEQLLILSRGRKTNVPIYKPQSQLSRLAWEAPLPVLRNRSAPLPHPGGTCPETLLTLGAHPPRSLTARVPRTC